MVRLFVGGLPPKVTLQALLDRFASFGEVIRGELPPQKAGSDQADTSSRGFGYVDLEPTNEAALRRCISVYNGCKWSGSTMRVEIAKPSKLAQLEEERCIDRATASNEYAAVQDTQLASDAGNSGEIAPLNLAGPNNQVIVTADGKKRQLFPPYTARPKDSLSWEAVPEPVHAHSPSLLGKRAEKRSATALDKPGKRQASAGMPAADERPRVNAASLAPAANDTKPAEKPSSDKLPGFVDFMTADDIVQGNGSSGHAAYDSSDNEAEDPPAEGRHRQSQGSKMALTDLTDARKTSSSSKGDDQDNMVAQVARVCAQVLGREGSVPPQSLANMQLELTDVSAILGELQEQDQDAVSDSSISDLDEQQWDQLCEQSEKDSKLSDVVEA